jgi:hypothetical protein
VDVDELITVALFVSVTATDDVDECWSEDSVWSVETTDDS